MQRRTGSVTALRALLKKHEISYREFAKGTGMHLTSAEVIIRGERHPRTDTVNRILKFLRTFDRAVTFEKIWGEVKQGSAAA